MFKMKSRKEGLMMIDRTYRISDVVNEEFLRFPLILLSNPRYKEMSLEAKFVYALLLNRLTLSQKNGWINEDNEVYLIFTGRKLPPFSTFRIKRLSLLSGN